MLRCFFIYFLIKSFLISNNTKGEKMKIWWEKTVEYKFVCDYCNNLLFLMPLDGNHETAGDTILNNSEKFILVEFKKEFTNIRDE